ncbi:MAG: beta-ketoacyl synthase, partial [Desulfuromonadaceae bacterium]|nr:beta-ketoacyl synthase [Desulfuromonadaceae bacterium]
MKGMQINGLGLVGGFGCGKADLLTALKEGCAPISQVELREHLFPLFKADGAALESYLNKRALRRIDHFSRLALLGAFQALEDAEQPQLDKARLGVVIGSGFGALTSTFKFLDSVLEDGDACASPTAFSNSVHNAAAAHISMQLKITGPNLTLSQFDQSLVSGLLSAQQWLDGGRVDAVLLGVVDEYCSVFGYCWERFLGK